MKLLSRLGRPHCLAIHVLVLFACFACLVPSAEAQTNNPPNLSNRSFPVTENTWSVIEELETSITDDDSVDTVQLPTLSGTDADFFRLTDEGPPGGWTLSAATSLTLDYERPVDKEHTDPTDPTKNDPAGNNVYVFTITVTSGTGAHCDSDVEGYSWQ